MIRLQAKNLIVFFLSLSVAVGMAQNADWKVAPKYSSLEPFIPGIYMFKDGKKPGLINTEGKVILPAKYGHISRFYDGNAVIYDVVPEGILFRGVISETGEVTLAEEKYYLYPEYIFFSEGYIPAIHPDGLYGFLGLDCKPAFTFGPDEVLPFSEGLAAIGSGEEFHYVDTTGNQIDIDLQGEYAIGGTNFYEGKALVWDEDWNCYILNDSGELESKGQYNLNDLALDYLHRFRSGKTSIPEYYTVEVKYDNQWIPSQNNGLWTFKNNSGKLLTPYIYEKIDKFSDGLAIAAIDGKYGLLEIVPDNSSFSISTVKNKHVYSPGNKVKCEFGIVIPEKWRGQNLTYALTDSENNVQVPIERNGNQFTFSYLPKGQTMTEKKSFVLSVKHGESSLWRGETGNFEFTQRAKLKASIRVNNADANRDDQCIVVATVRNDSSVPVTTTIHLSGGGSKASFANKTVTVTIPAYGTKSISSAFTVKKVELNGWCAVTTSDGASAKRSSLQLKPF